MYNADVIVIGAGPVGSFISKCLCEKGYKVLLLDKKEKIGRTVCAGVISREAFERFSLPRESILNSVNSITLFSPSLINISYKIRKPIAYIVDRVIFDCMLLESALSAGVEFKNYCRVTHIIPEKDKVKILCKMEGKYTCTFTAKMAVLSTAYSPRLTSSLGLGTYERVVFGAQVVCFMNDVSSVEVYFAKEFAPGGFAWLVPEGNGKVRAGVVVGEYSVKWLKKFLSLNRVAEKMAGDCAPLKCAFIPASPLKKTFAHRVVVVGEAAGQVKTTTYGGVYYGLLCASTAVNVIGKAFAKGDFTEKTLVEYDRLWRQQLESELEKGKKMWSWYNKLDDKAVDKIFSVFSNNGFLGKIKNMIVFDWHSSVIDFVFEKLKVT